MARPEEAPPGNTTGGIPAVGQEVPDTQVV